MKLVLLELRQRRVDLPTLLALELAHRRQMVLRVRSHHPVAEEYLIAVRTFVDFFRLIVVIIPFFSEEMLGQGEPRNAKESRSCSFRHRFIGNKSRRCLQIGFCVFFRFGVRRSLRSLSEMEIRVNPHVLFLESREVAQIAGVSESFVYLKL